MRQSLSDIVVCWGRAAVRVGRAAVLEILSPEGLIGLRACTFFDGALPDRIVGPHGIGLTLAIACRLAMNWDQYNLPRPSACDMYANDQLKMIWHTSKYKDLTLPDKDVWVIDLVLKAGFKGAEEECEEMRERNGISKNSEMHIVNDHKVFWQRLGQGVITRLFGLGASPAASMAKGAEGSFGPAWRLSDPGQHARDVALLCQVLVEVEHGLRRRRRPDRVEGALVQHQRRLVG